MGESREKRAPRVRGKRKRVQCYDLEWKDQDVTIEGVGILRAIGHCGFPTLREQLQKRMDYTMMQRDGWVQAGIGRCPLPLEQISSPSFSPSITHPRLKSAHGIGGG